MRELVAAGRIGPIISATFTLRTTYSLVRSNTASAFAHDGGALHDLGSQAPVRP
jgi:hypothetical protein